MRETTYKKIWKQIISCCLISSIVMTGTGIQTAAESVQPHLSMEVKSEKVAVNEEVAVEETNKEVTVGAEILKLRKEYSKTYEQSDGTNLTILSAAPFHYYDKKAKKWKDINNDLKKKEKKNGDIVYQNRKSDFEVELPKDMDQESQIKASYQGYSISVQLSDVSKSKGVTDNGTDKRPKIKLKEGAGQEAVIVAMHCQKVR